MAPFGKIYSYVGNPRTNSLLVVAKENNLEIEVVQTQPQAGPEYAKINKLGKVPTFVGADGYTLTECIAIAVYLTSQNEKTTLLGKTKQDYASILKWMSFANSEALPALAGWFRPLRGLDPYNKKSVETSQERTNKVVKVIEDHLLVNTYLVGERITLADIFCASMLGRGYEFVFDKAWRANYPSVTRWYETITNQSFYKSVAGDPILIDEAIKYTPPAKEKAAPKPKAAPAPAADDDDEEEAKPAPKPKHPIEDLGKATIPIDEWKRKYKNEDTREVALPWFWQNMNFDEYSIWKLDYKYNDELTLVFMSSNLIGGFFARLEASRKYIMGCASVYGENNNSIIQGAFVIRGQDATKAFDVAPDWESYEFTKLNPKDNKDQEFLNNQFSWDKPIEVDGKKYEWADGKVFV